MLQTKVPSRAARVRLAVPVLVRPPPERLLPHAVDTLKTEVAHQDLRRRYLDREMLRLRDLAPTFTIEAHLRIEVDPLRLVERNHLLVTRNTSREGHNRDLVTLLVRACIMKRRSAICR